MQSMEMLATYLHTLDPFLWRIHGDFGVRWYGVAYAAGFACAYLLLRWLARSGHARMKPEQAADFMLVAVFGVLLGGRIGWVMFYNPSALWTFSASFPFWEVLGINRGGMSSHGGIIGVIVAVCWWCRRNRIGILHQLDMAALVTPTGLGLGRLANFVNGELYGNACPEDFPLAVKFPQEIGDEWGLDQLRQAAAAAGEFGMTQAAWHDGVSRATAGDATALQRLMSLREGLQEAVMQGNERVIAVVEPLITPRYPSQIFQAAAEGVVLFIMLWTLLFLFKPRKPGVIGATFVLAYASLRIVTEHWRQPDLEIGRLWLGLSEGQWLSIIMIMLGIGSMYWVTRRPSGEPSAELSQSHTGGLA